MKVEPTDALIVADMQNDFLHPTHVAASCSIGSPS